MSPEAAILTFFFTFNLIGFACAAYVTFSKNA